MNIILFMIKFYINRECKYYLSKKTNIINQLEKKPNQKKIYLDKTDPSLGCTAVYSSEAEIIPAGTTVNSMPVSDKNEEYASLDDTLDIYFIFDDNIPVIDFFTIPYIDIFAYDSKGGLLGSVNEMTDLDSMAPIVYINPDHKCYKAGQTLKHFLTKGKHWQNGMKTWKKIRFFGSAEEANQMLLFFDP